MVDFGQVIAGRVALDCVLGEGQELVLRHAEALDAEGRFFENIVGRNKDQRDSFVGRGRRELMEPAFTFHGFRYVCIEGWDEALQGIFDPTCVEAHAIWASMTRTGRMVTSDARLNRLLENVIWSARGNLINVPTDCPQRERMGWVGDALIFAPTAAFLYDVDALMRQWLASVRADQLPDGQILDYSPAPRAIMGSAEFLGALSSAGWGDAIVHVPWTLWQHYSDRTALEDNYEAMYAWHDFCVASAAGEAPAVPGGELPPVKEGDDRYIWDTKFHHGDWMVRHVGGLAPTAPGYREILVAPHPVGDLSFCRTSFESVHGPFHVDWERIGDERLRVEVELPVGTSAHVRLPGWSEARVAGPGHHVFFE